MKDGKVNGENKYLRADEEMKSILAPPDVVEPKDTHLKKGAMLARVQGDLATVPSKEIQFVDISPRQTVSVSAAHRGRSLSSRLAESASRLRLIVERRLAT